MIAIGDKVKVTTAAVVSHNGQIAEVTALDESAKTYTVRFDDLTEETIAEQDLEEIDDVAGPEPQAGSLCAEAGNRATFRVLKGADPVPVLAGLTFERGIAKVGSEPLSLDGRWAFRWGVVIGDAEKYADAALRDYRDHITGLRISRTNAGQFYADIGEIGGYNAHISISGSDVRAQIKKLIERGREPGEGFLFGACRFHVTVEVEGQGNTNNPHVFDNQPGWKGALASRMTGYSTASAIALGNDWLRDNK